MRCIYCGKELRCKIVSSPATDYYGSMHGRTDSSLVYVPCECRQERHIEFDRTIRGKLVAKVEWVCPRCKHVNLTEPSKPSTLCKCGFRASYIDYSNH